MFVLDNPVRPYDWGSTTVLAELTGRPSPSPTPEAELWVGAHPGDSSVLLTPQGPRSLVEAIAADPRHHLGRTLQAEYQERLPFLFKVLAAARPLSLQTHPTPAQARAGFAAEESQGVPVDDPKRTYHDPYAKPELFVAQSDCEVLCGFRPPEQVVRIFAALDVPALAPYAESLQTGPAADGIRVVVTTLLSLPEHRRLELVDAVVAGARTALEDDDLADPVAEALRWVGRLAALHPTDVGVVLSLLLNHLHLHPGEALYLGPGQPHAYLNGWGLEAQANSDNTLRCGLTRKHVDVPELLRTLQFEPGVPAIVPAEPTADLDGVTSPGTVVWPTPAREFELTRWAVDGEVHLPDVGPQIVLVLEGAVTATSAEGPAVELSRGQSAYAAAADGAVELRGQAVVVRVTAGRCVRRQP